MVRLLEIDCPNVALMPSSEGPWYGSVRKPDMSPNNTAPGKPSLQRRMSAPGPSYQAYGRGAYQQQQYYASVPYGGSSWQVLAPSDRSLSYPYGHGLSQTMNMHSHVPAPPSNAGYYGYLPANAAAPGGAYAPPHAPQYSTGLVPQLQWRTDQLAPACAPMKLYLNPSTAGPAGPSLGAPSEAAHLGSHGNVFPVPGGAYWRHANYHAAAGAHHPYHHPAQAHCSGANLTLPGVAPGALAGTGAPGGGPSSAPPYASTASRVEPGAARIKRSLSPDAPGMTPEMEEAPAAVPTIGWGEAGARTPAYVKSAYGANACLATYLSSSGACASTAAAVPQTEGMWNAWGQHAPSPAGYSAWGNGGGGSAAGHANFAHAPEIAAPANDDSEDEQEEPAEAPNQHIRRAGSGGGGAGVRGGMHHIKVDPDRGEVMWRPSEHADPLSGASNSRPSVSQRVSRWELDRRRERDRRERAERAARWRDIMPRNSRTMEAPDGLAEDGGEEEDAGEEYDEDEDALSSVDDDDVEGAGEEDYEEEESLPCFCAPNGSALDDEAGVWVQCERCSRWCHGKCANLTKKQAESLEQYLCPPCLWPFGGPALNRLNALQNASLPFASESQHRFPAFSPRAYGESRLASATTPVKMARSLGGIRKKNKAKRGTSHRRNAVLIPKSRADEKRMLMQAIRASRRAPGESGEGRGGKGGGKGGSGKFGGRELGEGSEAGGEGGDDTGGDWKGESGPRQPAKKRSHKKMLPSPPTELDDAPREPRVAPVFNMSLMVEDSESDGEGGSRESCVVCKGHDRLLLCYGDRQPGEKSGSAERAHHMCKVCLDKWFSAHNELRVGVGLLPKSRNTCPVCRCSLRGSSMRSSAYCLGLLKVTETWPEGERGPKEGEEEQGEEDGEEDGEEEAEGGGGETQIVLDAVCVDCDDDEEGEGDASVGTVDAADQLSVGTSDVTDAASVGDKSASAQGRSEGPSDELRRRSSRFDPSHEELAALPTMPAIAEVALMRREQRGAI